MKKYKIKTVFLGFILLAFQMNASDEVDLKEEELTSLIRRPLGAISNQNIPGKQDGSEDENLFLKLPTEIKEMIFDYLPHGDFKSITATCKVLRRGYLPLLVKKSLLQFYDRRSLENPYARVNLKHPCRVRILNTPVLDEDLVHLNKARALDLSGCNNITSAGLMYLDLSCIHVLYISYSNIGKLAAKYLFEMGNLTTLKIASSGIGEEELKAIGGLTTLECLDISNNNIGNTGSVYLKNLTNLTSLDLGYNEIGDSGVESLVGLTNLTSLELENPEVFNNRSKREEITSVGASLIAKLTNLTSLNLNSHNIGNAGAIELINLYNLNYLAIDNNHIDEEHENILRENLINCDKIEIKNLTPATSDEEDI